MEKTQENFEKPPRSVTILGMAVETIVVSMAANIIVSISAANIQFLFSGKESSIACEGTYSGGNEPTVFCELFRVFLNPSSGLF